MSFIAAPGAVQWLTMARIVRGHKPYYERVCRCRPLAARSWRLYFIWFRTHGPAIVYTTLTVPIVIPEESFRHLLAQAQWGDRILDSHVLSETSSLSPIVGC